MHPRAGLGLGLLQRREGAGDRVDLVGQEAVHAAEHRVLFVDDGGALGGESRQQPRQGWIAAEADDDGRVEHLERRARLHHALEDGPAGAERAHRVALLEGRGAQGDAVFGGEVVGVFVAPLVGGQHDAPAALGQFFRQGLRREHVAAGAPGRQNSELTVHA